MTSPQKFGPEPFESPVYVTKPMIPERATVTQLFSEIWDAGILSNSGPKHDSLARRLPEHLGDGHISLFNNGTTALMVAVKALELSGEVLVTPFTFAATPHVLSWNGITPVFVDIEAEGMTLDPARLDEAVTDRTSGILATHVYGNPCKVDAIDSFAASRGLKVIYDGAHAFGTKVGGRHIGSYGNVTMFSFHATKLFHTAEGGATITRESALKERIDLLRNFGIVDERTVREAGINGKMNEVQAAIGLSLIDLVAAEKAKRSLVAAVYRSRLQQMAGIGLPRVQDPTVDSLQYFCIRVDERESGVHRDYLYDRLKTFNVFARKYFFPLCSTYDCYASHPSGRPGNLPNATTASEQVLCLPFFGALELSAAARICDAIEFIIEDARTLRRKGDAGF